MGTKVREIQRIKIDGGVQIIAKGRSNRGTKYILGSVKLLREGRSAADWTLAKREAIEKLLS